MTTVQDALLVVRSMDEPDERREPPLARIHVTTIGDTTIARAVAQPGWKWSTSVKPIAGTDSCEVAHAGYVIAGRLHVRMDDGAEAELTAGDVFVCAPGHDAWVVGDESVHFLEVAPKAAQEYAAPAQGEQLSGGRRSPAGDTELDVLRTPQERRSGG